VGSDGHRPAVDLVEISHHLNALLVQPLHHLTVVYGGTQGGQGAGLPDRLFHHLDGPPDPEAKAHVAGLDDLHAFFSA